MTRVIKYDKSKGTEQLQEAAACLRSGGTVVFPTETVYGLGANGLDADAASKIYKAKGRPSDNPLIIHIHDISLVDDLVVRVSDKAKLLMKHFWPGPLTLVMEKSALVPSGVTGGLNTVGVRMPSSEVALTLIGMAGVPVAAPSANVSGRPSPTKADHVLVDLDGRVDYIITDDNGRHGLESTVIDVSGPIPVLLRPGTITLTQMEAVIGEIQLDPTLLKNSEKLVPKAPGMKYRHYAPDADVYVLDEDLSDEACALIAARYEAKRQKVTYLLEKSPEVLGKQLFAFLIEADLQKVDVVLIRAVPAKDLGLAVMNRLLKAAGHKVLKE